MSEVINFLRSDAFGVVVLTSLFIVIAMLAYVLAKLFLLNKKYEAFMQKLSSGGNFEEMLAQYLKNVDEVKNDNKSLHHKIGELEQNMQKCIQKIGIVRYSAFQNTGSDLCFALALLDLEDNGVVINGIYSRDNTTTTYAKPIEKGVSKYTLVKEEEEALEMAKHSGYKYYLNVN